MLDNLIKYQVKGVPIPPELTEEEEKELRMLLKKNGRYAEDDEHGWWSFNEYDFSDCHLFVTKKKLLEWERGYKK